MKVEVSTTVEVDIDEAWRDLWGNDGHGFVYWCDAVRPLGWVDKPFDIWKRGDDGKYLEVKGEYGMTDWVPNPQDFMLHDAETDIWHSVTLERFAQAWLDWKHGDLKHCGGYGMDEPDACTEDYLAQLCVFGDVIYG